MRGKEAPRSSRDAHRGECDAERACSACDPSAGARAASLEPFVVGNEFEPAEGRAPAAGRQPRAVSLLAEEAAGVPIIRLPCVVVLANMTPVQIMDRIRKALDADERPQVEIAKAAKIHRVNLAQFKSGDRDLPLKALTTLADVLGMEITVKEKKGRL